MLALNIVASINPFIGRGATYDNSNALYFSSGYYYDGNYVGLYKSVDLGVTWTILASTKTFDISAVTRDINNSIYISLSNGFIKKSDDGGVSWTQLAKYTGGFTLNQVISGTPPASATSMTWNSTGIYALCGRYVWKSTDSGLTWECVVDTVTSLWTICATDNVVIVAGDAGVAFKSTDQGVTWNSTSVLAGRNWRASCAQGNTIYLGVANEYIYESTDDLLNVQVISHTAQNWQSAVALPDSTLFFGVYGARSIYKSSVVVGGMFALLNGEWKPVARKYVYLNDSWVSCAMSVYGNSKWN